MHGAGLRHVSTSELRLRRRRNGSGFVYLSAGGRPLSDAGIVRRLRRLAVPPAYRDVRYALDPRAHIQAIGRDAAGRLQYRYHPEWEKVRESIKAKRLLALIKSLPCIRRHVARCLAQREPTRDFALAAVIELIGRSAIRAGSESYARLNGTRGAATLLKKNISVAGDRVILKFRGKGGRLVEKDVRSPRLAVACKVLQRLPGARLFQYLDESGQVRRVTRRELNAYLREIAGVKISPKDFRTFVASAGVLEALAALEPAANARARNKQILGVVRDVAEELANTPAICRKSYVHATIFNAFEAGALRRHAAKLKEKSRSPAARETVLAEIVAASAG